MRLAEGGRKVTDEERAIIEDTKDGEDSPRRIEIVLVLDVLNEDRVRRLAAARMIESGFAGREEDIQSMDLSHLAYQALLGSAPDAIAPIDMGIEIVEAKCPPDGPDLWDSASTENDGFWFRQMPETTVDELFSEEHDLVRIVREHDGFWLGEEGRMGEGRYTTLAAAKSAGDRICREAYDAQPAMMVENAGLRAEDWTFSFEQGTIRFTRSDGACVETSADGMDERQAWYACLSDAPQQDPINDEPVDALADAIALLPPIK
jgi:hypothetical protein